MSASDSGHLGHQRRVLLKVSGEVFGGGSIGLDPDVVSDAAKQIAAAVRQGVQVMKSCRASAFITVPSIPM